MTTTRALRFLEPLESHRRGLAVAEALATMIRRAGLGIGDKLPPEVALADHLGVGRSTIRETMKKWEGLGLIRRRRGDGTYIAAPVGADPAVGAGFTIALDLSAQAASSREPPLTGGETLAPAGRGPWPLTIVQNRAALLRVLDVRRTLECAVVRRAAEQGSTVQKATIAQLYLAMTAQTAAHRTPEAAVWAFYDALYQAGGNPMYGQVLQYLDSIQASPKAATVPALIPDLPLLHALTQAIVAGDAETAVAAVNAIADHQAARLHAAEPAAAPA